MLCWNISPFSMILSEIASTHTLQHGILFGSAQTNFALKKPDNLFRTSINDGTMNGFLDNVISRHSLLHCLNWLGSQIGTSQSGVGQPNVWFLVCTLPFKEKRSDTFREFWSILRLLLRPFFICGNDTDVIVFTTNKHRFCCLLLLLSLTFMLMTRMARSRVTS